jgi:TonB family protein
MMYALASLLLALVAPGSLMPVQVEAPEYPESAVKAKMEGTIQVVVSVGADGSVSKAEATSRQNPLLASVSETAARQWRFKPSQEPTERTTTLTFEYSVRVDPPAKRECFVGPPRVTVVLPSTVQIQGWSRPPPPTVVYGKR